MNVGFNGLLKTEATFETINPVLEGQFVKITGNGTVAKASGENFHGYVIKDEGAYLGVQLKGYIEAEYTGTAPDFGTVQIEATEDGDGVQVVESDGVEVTVLYVDTENSIVGFIL